MNKLILSIENDGQFLSEESDSGEEVDQVPGNDYLDDLYDDESEEDKDVVDDGNIVVVTEESRGGGSHKNVGVQFTSRSKFLRTKFVL